MGVDWSAMRTGSLSRALKEGKFGLAEREDVLYFRTVG